MKIFYYVHTGHRIGLDRFRRAATIIKALSDIEITLLCSDFRIAQVAKDFGVKNSVGIDVVRNIPQIAHHGDKIIFDSDEANPIMLDDMRNFFSTLIRISDDEKDSKAENELLISPYLTGDGICTTTIVADEFFDKQQKSIKLSFFFGDDDYEKDIEKNLDFIDALELNLQLGFYYFLDYEDMLKQKFKKYHEFEDYSEMIKKTEILITASPQAVLDSLVTGAKPIYIKREDYTDNFDTLFTKLNIPIIKNYDKNILLTTINRIDNINYKMIGQNSNKFTKFIKENLNL